ncbi:hypothetical protein Chor_012953 [Crotalus horridus]
MAARWKGSDKTEEKNGASESDDSKNPPSKEKIRHASMRSCDFWFFAQKFSCGASVTGEDEIIIQGDFTDDIIEVIQEKWPEVDDDSIEDLGEVKK